MPIRNLRLRMLAWLSLVFCFGATALFGCASQPRPVADTPPLSSGTAERAPGPFLWEVRGKQGPVYLMGTIHMGIDAEKELPPAVWSALERSTLFVMEADISKVNPLLMMKYVQLPPDKSLDTMLSIEHWTALKARTSAVLPEVVLVRSRPWFVNTLLMQMTVPETPPMDLAFQERARAQRIKMDFLETWEFQVLMMNSLPEAYALDGLKMAISDPKAFERELNALLDAYRSGEEARVEAITLGELETYPKVMEMTLFKRNQSWIAPIESYLKEGNVFVAVGLAHLVGPQSVVALLREKGYTVERVELR